MNHCFRIILILLPAHFFAPAFSADPCKDDLSALYQLPDGVKLEGDALRTVIERLAHFELNEIQNSAKPPSAVAQMKQDLQTKISVAAERASLPEEAIRQQITSAKQQLVFGDAADSRSRRNEQLEKELKEVLQSQKPRFVRDRSLRSIAYNLALSPDGNRMVTGVINRVEFWNLESGRPPLERAMEYFPAVAYSSDGKFVVIADGRTIGIWDPETGDERKTLSPVVKGALGTVAIGNNNRQILAWWVDSKSDGILIWDVDSGSLVEMIQKEMPDGRAPINRSSARSVRTLAMDPTGQWILAVSNDEGAFIFQKEPEGKWWSRFRGPRFRRHGTWPGVSAAAIVPGKNVLLTADSSERKLHAWDLTTKKHQQDLDHPGSGKITSIKVSVSGELAATTTGDGFVQVWDLEKRSLVQRFEFPDLKYHPDNRAIWDFTGTRIAISTNGGTIAPFSYRKLTAAEIADWNNQ